MANGDIYLGASTLYLLPAIGRKFTITERESARQKRSLDGTLKKDFRYSKKTFTLAYSDISDALFNTLTFIYAAKTELTLRLEVNDSGGVLNYTVFMEPLKKTRETILNNNTIWSGTIVTLQEV